MTNKFYMETKNGTLESAVMDVWKNAAENNMSGEQSYEVGTDRYRQHTQDMTPGQQVEEGLEDSPNKANSQHLCAKNVVHEEWGEGNPVHGMHANPDSEGNIAWYDVMFEHGIEKGISINELKVTRSETHEGHKKNDKDKEMLRAKKEKEMSETNKNDKSDDGEGLDAVQPKAVKKKFADRKDKDIDNDGDTDDSDEFMHKKRKAISKAIDKKENVKESLSLRDTVIKMWTEASSAVNPKEREELGKSPEKTAAKMKRADEPAPMVATEEVDLDEAKKEKDEGNAFGKALMAAKEKGEKTFVVAGKKYDVQEELSLENAQQFKVSSMKQALAKVWGFTEAKSPEQQAAIAISKKDKSKKENAKTDTGGEMAAVEIDPKLKEK
jgi:hypothetical protein